MANIIEAVYPYSYTDDGGLEISFREGDRFLLLEKSSDDWWKVQRTGVFSGKSVCFVPASYMEEVNFKNNDRGHPTNHYVNLEVFQKIVQKDFDGLAKLGQKSLVISKDSSEDLPSPPSTPDSSFDSGSEVRVSTLFYLYRVFFNIPLGIPTPVNILLKTPFLYFHFISSLFPYSLLPITYFFPNPGDALLAKTFTVEFQILIFFKQNCY